MSSNHHSHTKNPQIFIAKLSPNIRQRELEYEFRKFGRIRNLQLKRGYAFIEFDDYRDADDAIHEMNGRRIMGQKIIVQSARGKRLSPIRQRRPGPQESDICYNCGKTGHWANECREVKKPKGKFYEDKNLSRSLSKERSDRRRSRSASKGSLENKSRSNSKDSRNKEGEKKSEERIKEDEKNFDQGNEENKDLGNGQ